MRQWLVPIVIVFMTVATLPSVSGADGLTCPDDHDDGGTGGDASERRWTPLGYVGGVAVTPGVLHGCIDQHDGRDAFVVDVEAGDTVRATLFATEGDIWPVGVSVTGEGADHRAWNRPGSGGTASDPEMNQATFPGATEAEVEVRWWATQRPDHVARWYTLVIDVIPDCGGEDVGGADSADHVDRAPLAAGTNDGCLAAGDDVDYFTIAAPEGSAWTARLTRTTGLAAAEGYEPPCPKGRLLVGEDTGWLHALSRRTDCGEQTVHFLATGDGTPITVVREDYGVSSGLVTPYVLELVQDAGSPCGTQDEGGSGGDARTKPLVTLTAGTYAGCVDSHDVYDAYRVPVDRGDLATITFTDDTCGELRERASMNTMPTTVDRTSCETTYTIHALADGDITLSARRDTRIVTVNYTIEVAIEQHAVPDLVFDLAAGAARWEATGPVRDFTVAITNDGATPWSRAFDVSVDLVDPVTGERSATDTLSTGFSTTPLAPGATWTGTVTLAVSLLPLDQEVRLRPNNPLDLDASNNEPTATSPSWASGLVP